MWTASKVATIAHEVVGGSRNAFALLELPTHQCLEDRCRDPSGAPDELSMAALRRLADIAERSNLPLQLTSFIGRSAEIDAVKGLLMELRLVTLTGAGGIGKTRLALEVARDLLGGYEDGVWLVELAGLTDPQLVPEAVMSALGYITPPGLTPTETLLSVIGPRELLCVLDNCEHLIETAAQLADLLLRRCPGLHMLATSRDVLGVDGEVTWRVPSMTTLDTHRTYGMEELRCCETVQLLIQRARAARPGFDLTDDNAAAVLRICHLVDGIPLAVELVAASTRAMSVTAIEERIAEQFNLITGGRRDIDAEAANTPGDLRLEPSAAER